ncbi:hypothetical protein AAFF_G00255060 [Aldrovandia affinis]|uniref:Apoptosis-associated speck-like protein containing a CARD n=1 Tax=Aldrovandia affinis TaxID=143900 RepID=A0AAD7W325_9TELE|nr:hypothetical protein AAFF_G00255060 [Aldrovandia affinis]
MAELILEILQDLTKEEFGRFKFYLTQGVPEGSRPIPQGQLEDQSRAGLATLMKGSYGDKMVNITWETLKKIPRNDLIEKYKLEKSLGATMGDTRGRASDSSVTQTEAGQHFVEKHKLELINRVSMVKPILDQLRHQGLINDETYKTITAEKTTYDQMRGLFYKVIDLGGWELKEALYRILKEENPALMRDLEGK